MGKLGNFEGIENPETKPTEKFETPPPATDDDRRKLDRTNVSSTNESNPADLKAGLDSSKDKTDTKKERLNKNPEKSGDFVQSGTALENPQFGEGGGKQYFVRDAFDKPIKDVDKIPLKNGCFENVGETKLQRGDTTKKKLSSDRWPDSESEREKVDLQQLNENTPDSPVPHERSLSGPKVDSRPLSKNEKAEVKQLDNNTLDEQGLTKVMPKGEQKGQDWKQAHSNQENRDGSTNPDSWTNPRQLRDGERFYQLRPSNADTASNYFTDAETVNKCRKENGDVDVDKLLQALQMDPGNNKDWTLREYVYRNNK